MGRLKKGIWVFNDASGEYASPGVDGRTIRYRDVLVDWLNRALSGPPADRDAAERIGALMKNMNQNTNEYLKAVDSWNAEGGPKLGFVPFCKTFEEIASDYGYELELDLCPRYGSKKWHLAFHCVTAPSGDAYERWQVLNEKGPDPQPLHEKWPDVPKRFNPECQAVNAVVSIALEGRLGTMRRCEIESCARWFLTKDDPRVRCCPDCDVDDLRKGTVKRKKQLSAAAKRARDRAKAEEQRHWRRGRADEFVKPGRRRAKD